MAQALSVWMNGQLVGIWSKSRSGTHIFEYEPSWITSEYVRPLSISLPIPIAGGEIRGEVVHNYFDNLLPDSQPIRERLQKRFKTKDIEAYSLLEAIGRDCVGALQLLPPGAKPEGFDRIDSIPLSEDEVYQHLNEASGGAVPGQFPDDNPLSDFACRCARENSSAAHRRQVASSPRRYAHFAHPQTAAGTNWRPYRDGHEHFCPE